VVFEKEYIMRCSSAEWIECLEMMPSWCRQENWGNYRIPWVNCAVLCVWKTTVNDSSEACAFANQNCADYSVFRSGMKSHSKITQFNWECVAPLHRLYEWSGQAARPRPTALLPPSSDGKPEAAAAAVVVAPDDGQEDARNTLSCI